jgi:hypothetical protein
VELFGGFLWGVSARKRDAVLRSEPYITMGDGPVTRLSDFAIL